MIPSLLFVLFFIQYQILRKKDRYKEWKNIEFILLVFLIFKKRFTQAFKRLIMNLVYCIGLKRGLVYE
jgi:hypothetical protein